MSLLPHPTVNSIEPIVPSVNRTCCSLLFPTIPLDWKAMLKGLPDVVELLSGMQHGRFPVHFMMLVF